MGDEDRWIADTHKHAHTCKPECPHAWITVVDPGSTKRFPGQPLWQQWQQIQSGQGSHLSRLIALTRRFVKTICSTSLRVGQGDQKFRVILVTQQMWGFEVNLGYLQNKLCIGKMTQQVKALLAWECRPWVECQQSKEREKKPKALLWRSHACVCEHTHNKAFSQEQYSAAHVNVHLFLLWFISFLSATAS